MKKTNPPRSTCLRRTMRAEGIPKGDTVESDIASASLTWPPSTASLNQVRNWSSGDGGALLGVRWSFVIYCSWGRTLILSGVGWIITSPMVAKTVVASLFRWMKIDGIVC